MKLNSNDIPLMVDLFLSEMEMQHRAVRQLYDGQYIRNPTVDEAQAYARRSLSTLISTGCRVEPSTLPEGQIRQEASPSTIESIRILITSHAKIEYLRNLLSCLEAEDVIKYLNDNQVVDLLGLNSETEGVCCDGHKAKISDR